MSGSTPTPFAFYGCVQVLELLGHECHNERELLEAMEHVPDEAVFHHTSGCLLRQTIGPAPYPNDFAVWVATELLDRRLAERLAAVDPFDARSVPDLRAAVVTILAEHVRQGAPTTSATAAEPFLFFRAHTIPVPSGHRATSLRELRDHLADVDVSALFFHIVEARFRLGRPRGDFSEWVAEALGQGELAAQLEAIDPYVGTLERVRDRYLTAIDRTLYTEAG